METFTAHKSVTIDVPASEVWEALIDPEMIKQYLFGTDAESDWKVGSQITYTGVFKGKPYKDKGTILKMVPNKVFQSTFYSGSSGLEDIPENYAVVTYELNEANGHTEVSVSQDRCPSKEACKDAEKNWELVLDNLKKMLEK